MRLFIFVIQFYGCFKLVIVINDADELLPGRSQVSIIYGFQDTRLGREHSAFLHGFCRGTCNMDAPAA